MIRLEIEEYCQECPKFEPTKKAIFYAGDRVYETVVICEYKEMCEEIAKHIGQNQNK